MIRSSLGKARFGRRFMCPEQGRSERFPHISRVVEASAITFSVLRPARMAVSVAGGGTEEDRHHRAGCAGLRLPDTAARDRGSRFACQLGR